MFLVVAGCAVVASSLFVVYSGASKNAAARDEVYRLYEVKRAATREAKVAHVHQDDPGRRCYLCWHLGIKCRKRQYGG